jgi:hypothetical protein
MSSDPNATVPGGTGASGQGRPLTWRDVHGETRRHADELICTEAEAAALHAVPRAGFWPATWDVTRTHWRRMLPGMFRPPRSPAVRRDRAVGGGDVHRGWPPAAGRALQDRARRAAHGAEIGAPV